MFSHNHFVLILCEGNMCLLTLFLNREKRNVISMVEGNGTVVYQTAFIVPPEASQHPEISLFYNAYAPNATVEVLYFHSLYLATVKFQLTIGALLCISLSIPMINTAQVLIWDTLLYQIT